MIIKIVLRENPDGTIHGYGGWVETQGVRYPVAWDVGPEDALPDGVTFQDLQTAARAKRWLLVDDAGQWRIDA